jgi:hypothetical protein
MMDERVKEAASALQNTQSILLTRKPSFHYWVNSSISQGIENDKGI